MSDEGLLEGISISLLTLYVTTPHDFITVLLMI